MIRNILIVVSAVCALDITDIDRVAAEISPAYGARAGEFFR
jgi:hypothetical protein